MRLLNFHGERLVSTDFRGKTIPPYAILSHRWGDAEVLYEDLAACTYKEKDGYRRIEFCAAQAARHGLQHFWIDTCCIDKWDRRERSKAINSMFRWYLVVRSRSGTLICFNIPRSSSEANYENCSSIT